VDVAPSAVPELLETRPGALTLDSPFRCVVLRCVLPARVCLVRQAVSRRQRTTQGSRGQGGSFPLCTERCPLGALIRAIVPGAAAITWRGCGPGGRFDRAADDLAQQEAARSRLRIVGLLDVVPCLDDLPPDADALADLGARR
jgi:hypothetical protein